MIAECLFPQSATKIIDGTGITVYNRPSDYDPPSGWNPAVHKNAARTARF
jgi:hypothetical protein